MTPISARCARCDSEFALFAVVEDGTGACPHCLQPLVAGDPGALLEWAAVADTAQYRLYASVHILQQLRGHLIVDWQSVLQSLAEEAGGESQWQVPPRRPRKEWRQVGAGPARSPIRELKGSSAF
jgi:hypothetical protein